MFFLFYFIHLKRKETNLGYPKFLKNVEFLILSIQIIAIYYSINQVLGSSISST